MAIKEVAPTNSQTEFHEFFAPPSKFYELDDILTKFH